MIRNHRESGNFDLFSQYMGKFEVMKNTQKEVFFRVSLLAKMVMQRESQKVIEEENLYKEIVENLLQQPDICLLKEQSLFYLVQSSYQNKNSFKKLETIKNDVENNEKVI